MEALEQVKNKKVFVFLLFMALIITSLFIFNHYFYKNQAAIATERAGLNATGIIEATNVTASFKVPGKIAKVFVDEGSFVEADQELATLESKEISSDLVAAQGAHEAAAGQAEQAANAVDLTRHQVESTIAQTQAKVDQAEIGVKDAKAAYDRATKLYAGGVISEKSLEDAANAYDLAKKKLEEAQAGLDQALSARKNIEVAQSQYQAAQGAVKQAEGAVQKANAYLDNIHLRAPMAGYITQKYLNQGEMVNAGTPVFEITDLANTFVNIYISEDKIGRVKLGQEAEIRVDAFPDKVFKGKVVLINGAGEFAVKKAVNEQYDHDLRSFKVRIDIPNQDLLLKTGMTARVKILEETE